MSKHRIPVRIAPEVRDRVKSLAAAEGMTLSSALELAADEWCDRATEPDDPMREIARRAQAAGTSRRAYLRMLLQQRTDPPAGPSV